MRVMDQRTDTQDGSLDLIEAEDIPDVPIRVALSPLQVQR